MSVCGFADKNCWGRWRRWLTGDLDEVRSQLDEDQLGSRIVDFDRVGINSGCFA
jgi:hypothetical protein